ncbi:MAG: hypothetical protein KKD44_28700, partial [Proteobacteria bacterium]|nr:hypothetical protein [Pseudomonadota bacterium]
NGFAYKSDYQLKKGLRELSRTAKIFIPFYLGGEDIVNYLTGKKKLKEIVFYGKTPKKDKTEKFKLKRSKRRGMKKHRLKF